MSYYDGTKLLSMKDINGNRPEIYMATGNRTGGKTTYFNRLLVNHHKKKGTKFMLLYRFNYELADVADKFFKDIHGLFFPNDYMSSKPMCKGMYHELFLNDEPCGYAVTLNNSNGVKLYSHLFSDTSEMMLDEFQSETDHYCTNEIQKLLSIHTSVARGQGKQNRYVPMYMCANTVSLLNPYYTAMGISSRLKDGTNFLRGDGFVLEQAFIESAANAMKESGFNKAFKDNKYVQYASQNVYLNDNYSFIEKPSGRGRYAMTIKYMGKHYALIEYDKLGIVYVSDKADMGCPIKMALTTDDHNVNYLMLSNNALIVGHYRDLFNKGCFRFKNLECKQMVMTLLSY